MLSLLGWLFTSQALETRKLFNFECIGISIIRYEMPILFVVMALYYSVNLEPNIFKLAANL